MISFAPDPSAVKFLYDRLGVDFSGVDLGHDKYFCCTAYDDLGRVSGALVAEFKTPFDAHLTMAADDVHLGSRKLLRLIFRVLFTRAKRVTALIEPTNTHCIDLATRIGFQREGFARRIIDGQRDGLIYGLLPEDCRVLFNAKPRNVSRETLPRLRVV